MNVGDRIEVTGGPLTHASWIGKRGTVLDIQTSSFDTTWVVCNMDEEGQVEFRKASLTVVPA